MRFLSVDHEHILTRKKTSLYSRGCCSKFATGLNTIISHSSKGIWVIKLSFCQNDSLIIESFWQKDNLITYILFELWLIMILSPVANFVQQSLLQKKFNPWWSYLWLKKSNVVANQKSFEYSRAFFLAIV